MGGFSMGLAFGIVLGQAFMFGWSALKDIRYTHGDMVPSGNTLSFLCSALAVFCLSINIFK